MGSLLAFRVDTGAVMLHKSRSRPETAIPLDRKNGHAATVIVGHQYVFPGLVYRKVAGCCAARCHFVQKSELAGCTINGKGTYGAAASPLVQRQLIDGVKESAAGINRQNDGSALSAASPSGVNFPVAASKR